MSANDTGNQMYNNTHHVYYFYNQIPIQSYLIALAVGDLEYRAIDNRTGVICEPVSLDRVANELSELGEYLTEAENQLGPYIWGTYAILILPGSFPFGGMENPLLTFASPTIITGEKD